MSDLYDYWSNLSQSDREVFATNSGFKVAYVNTHLIHRRKVPPLAALKRLADASNGELTYHGLCDFFISDELEPA
ncbi:hypothetical protein [Psychrobacter sp. JB193]|uniref:hypothetical protein n=1 Tax=Psychrobacter sp. JB193 TaxID=2024406 RepID=UPI000BAACABD|nr:hypothetical protein [Psychrobacter sp. JB193]PAT63962.1 hypothetical protein CIK80_02290 [Psychrobacter sp. JB193]